MGCLYKRKQKLPNGDYRELPTWWIKYYQGGRPVRESTGTEKETVALRILRSRLGDVEKGIPITPKMGRITFEDAVDDLLNDYRINERKSIESLEDRLAYLKAAFKGKRLISITSTEVRAYAADRKAAGAANATINRELSALKRMFSLAVQGGKLHAKPHIPLLQENNARKGFFEAAQFESVCRHLPAPLRSLARVAYITGWRVKSEILPLEWRRVDWAGRVVRLDPGTTKNREGRSFPFTAALEQLLKDQHVEHERLKAEGRIVPWVFFRMKGPREGPKHPVRIRNFRRAWRAACSAAGVPGHIPHDFRRTAVRNLERAGVPRSTAMAMVGHKTESIYRRYAIVDAGALRDAASKLDQAAGTISGTIAPTPADAQQHTA